jgi:hypothetical protein
MPFELGMYWKNDEVLYIERQPNRNVYQGLIPNMLVPKKIVLDMDTEEGSQTHFHNIEIMGPEMLRCIKAEHPSPTRCVEALTSGNYANKVAAFDRHFALVRGPADSLFLVYKASVIGVLPNGDFSKVRIGKNFRYCKEAVEDLHLFASVTI